jgi:cellulose synthase/poly-beta-1,6-N-acetylglucosamine synthase-like glycosyltransferase
MPAISVIIPTLNEERCIARCLAALQLQSLPADAFEVIVVDNGSSDRTVEIAGGFATVLNLRILCQPGCRISALRNHAAEVAGGAFLAFLDADCIAPADWLERGVALLHSDVYRVIGAHYRIPDHSSWVARTWYGDLWRLKQGLVSYVPAGNMLISREAFLELGGFDEGLTTSEDCDFCQRVSESGMRVIGVPALSVVHLGTPQTLRGFYRKQRWHGTGVNAVAFRDKRRARGAKHVFLAAHTLFALAVLAAASSIAPFVRSPGPLYAAFVFLLLTPLLLAARAGMIRKRPSVILPLVVMYLTYGVARALCLLGLNGERRPAPAQPPPVRTVPDRSRA